MRSLPFALAVVGTLPLIFAPPLHADIQVEIPSTQILIAQDEEVALTIDVTARNIGDTSLTLYGYDLFYDFTDIEGLPAGLTFDDPPAAAGGMFPASLGFVFQTSEAATGDLALSEFQFSPIAMEPGDSKLLHRLHMRIDGAVVGSSDWTLSLDQSLPGDGFSDTLTTKIDPSFVAGTFSITAVPEPAAASFFLVMAWLAVSRSTRPESN